MIEWFSRKLTDAQEEMWNTLSKPNQQRKRKTVLYAATGSCTVFVYFYEVNKKTDISVVVDKVEMTSGFKVNLTPASKSEGYFADIVFDVPPYKNYVVEISAVVEQH